MSNFEGVSRSRHIPDGRYGVADEPPEYTVGVYDLATRKVFGLPRFGDAAFWDDGSRVVHLTTSWLSIWAIPSGKELKRLRVTPPSESDDSRLMCLSPRANLLAVGRHPKSNLVSLISLDSGKVLGTVECGPPMTICERIRLSTDGRILVTGTSAVNSHDELVQPLAQNLATSREMVNGRGWVVQGLLTPWAPRDPGVSNELLI